MSQEFFQVKKDENLRKSFGNRLKEFRKQRNWSQKELCAKLDTQLSILNKYEGGLHVPPIEKLLEIAELFNTSVDYLLTGNQSETRPLHNLRLMERFKVLESFQSEDQETVIRVIDAMIVKNRVAGALKEF